MKNPPTQSPKNPSKIGRFEGLRRKKIPFIGGEGRMGGEAGWIDAFANYTISDVAQ